MALMDKLNEMAKRPITSEERDAIKKDFSLTTDVVVPVGNAGLEQTSEQPRQPVAQATQSGNTQPIAPISNTPYVKEVQTEHLTPKTSLESILAAKQGASKLTRPSSFTDYLPLLAPIAVEALFGGGKTSGFSLGMSGKAILDKEAEAQKNVKSLEDKLMEMQSLKSAVKYGTGEMDKEAGKQARFESAQKQRQELADRQIKLATRDKLNQNKEFQANLGRYNATNDAINVLNKKNWAGDAGVGFLFAKGIFREVGALTNEERTQFIADPLLSNKFTYLYEKYLKKGGGTFTSDDRKDLTELAVHMRERAKQDVQRVANSYIEGVKSIGIDPSGIINPLLVTDDVVPKYIKTGFENRPKYYEQNGFIYKLNEKTGKYE
jgi:hypothetical protein